MVQIIFGSEFGSGRTVKKFPLFWRERQNRGEVGRVSRDFLINGQGNPLL